MIRAHFLHFANPHLQNFLAILLEQDSIINLANQPFHYILSCLIDFTVDIPNYL